MQTANTANNTEAAKSYLTILDAALRIGVSPDTIRRRVKDGVLPATKFAGKYLIRAEDVDRMVEEAA